MIDIQQVKKDFENGVLISRATWEKVIEAALTMSLALEFYADGNKWDEYQQDQWAVTLDRNVGSDLGSDCGNMAREALK